MDKELISAELKDLYSQVVDLDDSIIMISVVLFVYIMFLLLTRKGKKRED